MNWDSGLPEYSVNNHFEKKKKKMNEQIDGSFVRFQKRKVAAGGDKNKNKNKNTGTNTNTNKNKNTDKVKLKLKA